MPDYQKHILLVEDEVALRSAIAERLAGDGFEVTEAGTGEEALTRLEEFAFDVVVTDLRLPGIDGASLLDAALDRYPDMCIICRGVAPSENRYPSIRCPVVGDMPPVTRDR